MCLKSEMIKEIRFYEYGHMHDESALCKLTIRQSSQGS
jgi:hypothetical protein